MRSGLVCGRDGGDNAISAEASSNVRRANCCGATAYVSGATRARLAAFLLLFANFRRLERAETSAAAAS